MDNASPCSLLWQLENSIFLTSVHCNVHALDSICGRKPVIIAAKEGHTNIIAFFLLQGLLVNEADSIGWTLLHYAAWKGNSETVRFLIQKGASISVTDKCSGKTPVHVATEEGHIEVVQFLVNSGANIEEVTEERVTPLHPAAYEGHLVIAKFLADIGANLNAEDINGWTPLYWAAYKGHLVIVEFLVNRKANLNAGDNQGFNASSSSSVWRTISNR